MLPQGGAAVLRAEHAPFLQQRHDGVGEFVEAVGRDVGYEDEAVRRVVLHQVVDGGGDRGRRTDEGLPSGDLDDELADRQLFRLGPGPPFAGGGDRVPVLPEAGAAAARPSRSVTAARAASTVNVSGRPTTSRS